MGSDITQDVQPDFSATQLSKGYLTSSAEEVKGGLSVELATLLYFSNYSTP